MTGPRPLLRRAQAMAARLLLVAAAATIVLLAAAGRAEAHATLLFTTPAAETAEPASPTSVVLVFNEPVTVGRDALTVLAASGVRVGFAPAATTRGGTTVTARLTDTLPTGVYTVRWRVTGADGDLVEGQFRFAVGATLSGSASVAGENGTGGTSWPTAVARWVLLAGLSLAAGGVVGGRLVTSARKVNPALPAVQGWTGVGALVGVVAATTLTLQLGAQTSGAELWRSTPVEVATVQAVAFAIALVAQALRRTGWTAAVLAVVVVVAEAVRAHPNIELPGWGAALTAVHVGAAAVWAGTLAHVLRTAVVWRSQRGAIWWLVSAYARLAVWLVLLLAATGVVSGLLLVSPAAVATTGYGRLLLAKLALVAAAVALALIARRRLRRGPDQVLRVGRPARAEAGVLVAVLAVTAVLTATPTAPDATSGQIPPPAPTGPVVPLGSLAGQVGVGVAASAGQLVVHLAAPSRQDYYTPGGDTQAFGLSARLAPPSNGGDAARPVRLRGCGRGCYVADVDWQVGENLLTLRASAAGWRGGTVSLLVPWPVQPGGDRLAAAVTAMKAAGELTVYESVTSDTSTPLAEPTALPLTGAEYVALQPYNTGVAPQVVRLPAGPDGRVRLALGFPAEARYVQLTLDGQGRLVDEVQVDPKHLTRHHFTYHGKTGG